MTINDFLLMFTNRFGNLKGIKFLLEHGANIFSKNTDGDTVLTLVLKNNNLKLLKFLLKYADNTDNTYNKKCDNILFFTITIINGNLSRMQFVPIGVYFLYSIDF